MADNQTYAALAEAILNARITFVNGTEGEWATANPVLLDGEIGLVKGSKPLKFKLGDGVKKWSELGWGQAFSLSQLAADATHRLVTDEQITKWDNKAEKTPATTTADGLMSAADKTKLNGVAAGANNYVHPTAHPATMITEDSSHRFATDAEKTKWNGKAEKTAATTAADGLMSAADKTKLNGVAAGANNYVHPTAHPATMITEDSSHRFSTDAEKTKWNGKAEKTPATSAADGLMSKSDKAKLDGVAAGANNYIHPASHPATMITPDASHRFATDAEKAKWNGKARVITFNWGAYKNIDPATSNAQKEIVKDIVRSVNAGENLVIFAMDVKPSTTFRETVSGVVRISSKSSSQVGGVVQDFALDSNSDGNSIYLFTAAIIFKSDGTATIELLELTHELITTEGLPEYSTEKAPTVSGFAATYYLTKGGQRIGVPINIPLDQVLRGSSIKTVATANSPYTGAKVGDKYIEFLFQNNNTPQYLPVQDLVDVYKGDNTYIQVSASNVITLNYAGLKTKLQTDFGSVFDPKGAGTAAAQKAIDEFKASSFIIQCTIPGMN